MRGLFRRTSSNEVNVRKETVELHRRVVLGLCTVIGLLGLAACSPASHATQAMLEERGVLRPVVSEADWLFGPCGWSEPYVARFVGRFEGRLVTGVVCATSESAEEARLVDVRRPWAGRER